MSLRSHRLATALTLVLVGLVGACSLVTSTMDTTQALQSDGFGNVRVLPTAYNGGTVVRVSGEAPPGADRPEQMAARDVWDHFAFRLSSLEVRLAKRPTVSYSRAELETMLGPRPAGLDDNSVGQSVGRAAVQVLVAGSGALLVVVGLISFFVVRNRRRRPRPPVPAGWPGYGPLPPPAAPHPPAGSPERGGYGYRRSTAPPP